MAIKGGVRARQRAPQREVERHDAMAHIAWTAGYLYGMGKAQIAHALARKRIMDNVRRRRAAHDVAGALDRHRKRFLENAR
jgi:hypothetical protein